MIVACGGGSGDDGPTSPAPMAAGEIDERGGTVAAEGVTLIVPAGALDKPTTITIRVAEPTRAEDETYSPVYRFEPEGLSFKVPATVSIAHASGADPAIYWTSSLDPEIFVLSPGQDDGTKATASVAHFSRGFVGAPKCRSNAECKLGPSCSRTLVSCAMTKGRASVVRSCTCAGGKYTCDVESERPCTSTDGGGADGGSPDGDAATTDASPTCDGGTCILASSQDSPDDIIVYDGAVYWRSGGGAPGAFSVVKRCAVTGCGGTPTVLSPGGVQTGGGFWVDAAGFFWTDTTLGRVVQCPLTGCGAETVLASGLDHPSYLALDATSVYWTIGGSSGSVWKCPRSGCVGAPTELAALQEKPVSLVVDGANLYWANITTGSVVTCPIGGCGLPTVLGTTPGPQPYTYNIAVDATNVYWTGQNSGVVMKCAKAGCGGTPTVLASGQQLPHGIATDGTNVYWVNRSNGTANSGTIQKCAVGGCAGGPTTIASGQDTPSKIAVDGTKVYWTGGGAGGGTVMTAPK